MKSEFWKNAECDRIDRESEGGDVLRGLPRRDFPWAVASEEFVDAEGDAWKCVVLCHDVQPGRTPQTVKVRVELKASCVLSDENLERMGLSPSRLRAMHDETPARVEDGTERTTELPLDDLEKACRKWILSARIDLLLRYSFNRKQTIVWDRVRKRPLSRFSTPD